ncbi:MAG: WecB/TagA/CpsF family glycosyltransferase [Pirellulales bacterium]|nr:WecB/TagA/CpsF family glycosyltransferase [Pirellulales bacterium]
MNNGKTSESVKSGCGRSAFESEAYFTVLGVRILNIRKQRGIELLEEVLRRREGRAKSVFFVNAHTLNLAAADPQYRELLNGGDFVFGDGTGVRWAARLNGARMCDNLQGTDFTPSLLKATAERGYSYFMLGGDEPTIAQAARYAQENFPGWRLAGFHHGYLKNPELNAAVIDVINAARPDLLLVGMGNPLQERWIHDHLGRLDTSLCLGIGGLFDFWAGNVSRAPAWLRKAGHEWLWRLFQQPREKARRYLVGNPLFLARIMAERLRGEGRGEGRGERGEE